MREIKFRAWDGGRRVMIRFDEIESIAFRHDALDQRAIDYIAYVAVYADKNGDPEPSLDRAKGADVVLSQFTGLKDRNGCEVYDGDVVRNPGGFNYVIEFMNGSFIPKYKGKPYWHCQFEIIGNIYENPGLTKD